jgi:dephospho-CoA kinase
MKKVIAIIGPIASGKGTAADFLVKKGFLQITMSDFLRIEARKRKIKPDRHYFRKLQAELRRKYGANVLVNKAIDKIKNSKKEKFVIDGLRDYRETKYAKKKLKLKIILINADPYVRFVRQRDRARHGFSKTYHEFLHEDSKENAIFDFHKTMRLADYTIISNDGKLELYNEFKKLYKKL